MIQLLHNFHLAFYAFPSIWLHQLYLLVNFHRNLLIEHLVQAQSHDSIGTLPYSLPDKIIIQIFYRTIRCTKFYNFLIWLSFTFVHLSFIQWMSIKNFACVCCRILLHSCHLLSILLLISRFSCVSHTIYVSSLNLRCFGHNQSFIWTLLILICEVWSDIWNIWHVLCSIKFFAIWTIDNFEISRLAFRHPTTHNFVDISIVLLNYYVFLATSRDIFISCQVMLLICIWSFSSILSVWLDLIGTCWLVFGLGLHGVSFVMLEIVKLDLPDVRACDVRETASVLGHLIL